MYDELIAVIKDLIPEARRNSQNYTASVLEKAADAIEELSQPRWIPVTERLPEKTNRYLVHIECKCDGELMSKWTQTAWFCKKFYWEHSHGTAFFEETVTHWMPLPEPPKEET